MRTGTTIADLQRQVRRLKEAKGFEITLEHRLVYPIPEVGEVAAEVLKLSRDGNADVGEMDDAQTEAVVEASGMEIYDVAWNLLDLAEMTDADLERAFAQKARLNQMREW